MELPGMSVRSSACREAHRWYMCTTIHRHDRNCHADHREQVNYTKYTKFTIFYDK